MKNVIISFLSQTLILSLVLMPYQGIASDDSEKQAERAAKMVEEEECDQGTTIDGVYTSGTCVAKTIENAQLTNHGGYKKKWIKWIEQAIVGMSAVNLVEALKYKGKDEIYKNAYGKTCDKNFGAVWTPKILATGAGAFLIGDIWANTYFRNASKDAFDEKFAKKTTKYTDDKTVVDVQASVDLSAEGNAPDFDSSDVSGYDETLAEFQASIKNKKDMQLEGYDALIKILNKQKDGMEIKVGFAIAAESAYLASIITEGLSIRGCNNVCLATKKQLKQDWKTYKQSAKTAEDTIKNAKDTADGAYDTAKAARETAQSSGYGTLALAPLIAVEVLAKTVKESCGLLKKGFSGFVKKTKSDKPRKLAKAVRKTVKHEKKALKGTKTAKEIFEKIKDLFLKDSSKVVSQLAEASDDIKKDNAVDDAEEEKAIKIAEQVQTKLKTTIQASATVDQTTFETLNGLADVCTQAKVDVGSALSDFVSYKYQYLKGCGAEGLCSNYDSEISTSIQNVKASTQSSAAISFEITGKGIGIVGSEGLMQSMTSFQSTKDIMKDVRKGKITSFHEKENQNFFMKERFEIMLRQSLIGVYSEGELKNPIQLIGRIKSDEIKLRSVVRDYSQFLNDYFREYDNFTLGQVRENKKWQSILNKITDLFVPQAHAVSGMVQMAGGALLGMAEKLNIKGPWAPIMSVGSRFLMVQAVLKRYFRNYGMIKPQGRIVSGGVLAGVTALTIATDFEAIKKIKQNIAFMEEEKKRFESGEGAGLNVEKTTLGGTAASPGYGANDYTSGDRKIATCLNFRNSTFVPSSCSKNNKVPTLNASQVSKLLPSGIQGAFNSNISSLSNLSKKMATGDGANIGGNRGADFNFMASNNAALRKYAQSLIKDIDKKNGQDKNPTSIANSIDSMKGALGISNSLGEASAPPALSSFGSAKNGSVSSDSKKTSLSSNGASKKSNTSGGSSGAASFASGGDDLDFGDEDESANDMLAGGDEKEALKLDDFELDHDDINKKKEISIFKILSNRYLLSYPVFLEKK